MNRKFSILTVTLTAFALWAGGCNLAPKYQRPSVETPEAFKEAAAWKSAQPKDDARRGNWWEVFGDPQLNALEEQVSVSNQNIAAAFANFLAARAAVKEARAAYYPVLTTSPSATRSHESGTPPPVPSTASYNWSLYSLPFDASWMVFRYGHAYMERMLELALRQTAAEPPPVEVAAPSIVQTMVHVQGQRLVVHLLNDISSLGRSQNVAGASLYERREVIPIHGIKVTFRGSEWRKIFLMPGEKALTPVPTPDGLQVSLPPLEIHAMVVAEP